MSFCAHLLLSVWARLPLCCSINFVVSDSSQTFSQCSQQDVRDDDSCGCQRLRVVAREILWVFFTAPHLVDLSLKGSCDEMQLGEIQRIKTWLQLNTAERMFYLTWFDFRILFHKKKFSYWTDAALSSFSCQMILLKHKKYFGVGHFLTLYFCVCLAFCSFVTHPLSQGQRLFIRLVWRRKS